MTVDTPGRTPRPSTTGAVAVRSSELRVDEGMRGHFQVVEQRLTVHIVEGRRVDRCDRDMHAAQPGVALEGADLERRVPHPQPGMAALVGVCARAAPVLLEEHPEPDLGGREVVFGVQTPQNFVLGDQLVKARHDRMERIRAADSVVKGLLWLFHRLHCGPCPEGAAMRLRRAWLPAVHRIDQRAPAIWRALADESWWTVLRRTYGAAQTPPPQFGCR